MDKPGIHLQSHPRSDLQPTLRALRHLLDRETGLIQELDWYAVRYDDPQLEHCHTTLADIGCFTGQEANRYTGGTALTKQAALAKAIGESVERYCADLADRDDVLLAPYREVRGRATDPRRYVLWPSSHGQRADWPFVPAGEEVAIGWVQGFSLTRGEPTLTPATIVHVPYEPHAPGDRFEVGPVSGYACAATLEEAILGGIYEVVERDAFMIFWYNWLPAPVFDLRSVTSPELRQTLDRYHSAPVRLYCADITTDVGIPAVLAVMTGQPPWPAAVVATAAGLDVEAAAAHALYELAANHLSVRWQLEQGRHAPANLADIAGPEDHGLLYTNPELLPYLAPVLQPRGLVRFQDVSVRAPADVKACIELCVQRLAQQDLEVIVVELTTPDVAELGFRVVKVLIPGMQPLDFGLEYLHLGGRRIYEVPRRLGYRSRNTEPQELNLFPHPFP